MAKPTRVSSAETVFNTSTTPKNTGNLTTLAGDIVVPCLVVEDSAAADNTYTIAGNSISFGAPQVDSDAANYGTVTMWRGTDAAGGTFAHTFTRTGGEVRWFGGKVFQFRGSDGSGAVNSNSGTSGAPTCGLTTTQDNSAVVAVAVDWNAVDGAGRTWLTVGDAIEDEEYFRDASHYTLYMAVYPDVGSAGAKTFGLSGPTGQKWRMGVVEIKGTAGGGGGPAFSGILGGGVGSGSYLIGA